MDRRRALMMAGAEDDLILNDLLTLDGIKNTRAGHDANATTWQDLSGNNYDTVKVASANNPVWQSNHAVFDATNRGQFIEHDFFGGRTKATVELVIQITGNGSRYINGFNQGFIFSNRSGDETHLKGLYTYSYNAGGVSAYVNFDTLGYSPTSSGPTYICYVFDGNTCKRYVNGQLAATHTVTYADLSKNTNRIGYEFASDYVGFPSCNLYRIGISSTAFDADTVALRYQKFRQRFNF